MQRVESTLAEIRKKDKDCGHAFPTGINLNEIAAHDTRIYDHMEIKKLYDIQADNMVDGTTLAALCLSKRSCRCSESFQFVFS